jgi:O-glycosyl hydrolase
MQRLTGPALLAVVATATAVVAADLVEVRLDPTRTYQPIDGFGASDAWRCQFVGAHWPLAKRERIAELLFSREVDAAGHPRGIGLSLWRFYLSAGTAEQGEASGIANPWRRGECFLNADGSYDWSKQAGQQWFLQAARRHGVERTLAFVNAPPVSLSRNGKGFADRGDISLNLRDGALPQYVQFLAEVLEHFHHEGQSFDYLSPFNEPQWNWDEGDQEGTPARNDELAELIRALSVELTRRQLPTQLVVGEAGTIGHVAKKMDDDQRDDQARQFFDPRSPLYVGQLPQVARIISAHSYYSVWPLDKQVEYRRMLHAALQQVDPELGYWMSEYCILQPNGEIGQGGGRDLGMDTALYVARILHHDLTQAQARSWQWWTALSQVDYKDGLVYLDDGSAGATGRMGPDVASLQRDGAIRDSKLLWTLGNYARFVRPGMVRIGCETTPAPSPVDGVLASAYAAARGERIAVLINLGRTAVRCRLGAGGPVEVYLTASDANLTRRTANAADVELPPRSVTTVCWPPAAAP